MPIYNNVNELINDAVKRGIIKISELNIPSNAIHILKPDDWQEFLQYIIDNSDEDTEVYQATIFLNMLQQIKYVQEIQTKEIRQNPIDEIDINYLSKQLESCSSIDDVLTVIDDNLLSKSLTNIVNKKSTEVQNTLKKMSNQPFRWKKPVNINGKSRYYSYNTNWFIERQELRGPNGGRIVYFSIFSPKGCEKARFDKLKDAKMNMPQVIQQLN